VGLSFLPGVLMVKYVLYFLCVVAGAAGALVFASHSVSDIPKKRAVKEAVTAKSVVEKNLTTLQKIIISQLSAFSGVVSENQEFVMKLAVEKDVSAPEIVDITGNYMKVMRLSFLKIVDDSGTILSAGEFAARAGTKIYFPLSSENRAVVFIIDDIKGRAVLSIQGKFDFVCSGIPLHCIGGMVVDDDFLSLLRPSETTLVVLKQGNDFRGMSAIRTISEIKDSIIMINEKMWMVLTLPLPWYGEKIRPELLVLTDVSEDFSLRTFFK
jgi:hypothetical protein